jgi:POT family proton-dependent oligopeptide transporter
VIQAGWFQSLNPVFIISLSPVMASLWVMLANRGKNPSVPAKFGIALILLGLGFLIMVAGSRLLGSSPRVWPTWLIATYLVHTVAELCLSPVGLSAVTKLAPERFVGQMMGMWFLASSLGSLVAGLMASEIRSAAQMPAIYLRITVMSVTAGLILLVWVPLMRKWVKGLD